MLITKSLTLFGSKTCSLNGCSCRRCTHLQADFFCNMLSCALLSLIASALVFRRFLIAAVSGDLPVCGWMRQSLVCYILHHALIHGLRQPLSTSHSWMRSGLLRHE